ncbi:MAG: lipopolysaccharide heptosyltransferase II [Nitrospirae bacterium]|nr:lipopolysaccharide heptosyltransferase II [Nitrospirota bacterium]
MEVIKLDRIPQKILVIKPSSLGDIVHSLPFLNTLRESFPRSEIHWVVARGLEGLLEGHPMINKLWIINKDEWKKIRKVKGTIKEIRALFSLLKREKFDLVVDLQGLMRSSILAAATGASLRIGFKEAREGSRMFYTHRVTGGRDIHAVDRYLKIAEFLGCDISEVQFPFPLFELSTFKLQLPEEYAVIVPGARWKTKRWPPERFGELASMLPLRFFVAGSKSDMDIADRVVKNSKGNAVSMAGKTSIKELIELMRRARVVVSNDSGPMHVAAAFHVPVFAIFGPTNPLRTGPYGSGHFIIRKELECLPCYKKNCRSVRCMDMIDVSMVADIIKMNW